MGPVVDTPLGKVRGKEKDGVHVFRGLPYAQPPVGERRFRAPAPPEAWSGVREATRFGGACPQDEVPVMRVGDQSEDCLYLNIWTPSLAGAKRPVMVWIHGGAFVVGSGAQPEYDGTELAKRGDVVVVTLNYRLGAFGYAYFRELLGDRFPCESNLGVRDQLAALRWVRDHISAFGGDPRCVTVFGESAGGMSVATLLGTPSAQGLFHRAIPQSGAAHHCFSAREATRVAEVLLEALSVDRAHPEALRSVPPEALLKAMRRAARLRTRTGPWQLPSLGMSFLPVVDGELLPDHPQTLIEQGAAGDVPLLVGTTRDEWRLFMDMTKLVPRKSGSKPPPWESATPETLPELLDKAVPGHGLRAAEAYRRALGEGAGVREIFQALETDRVFRIPAIRLAEAQARHQPHTYMYRFDWRSPMFGACHAVDIPLVFHSVDSAFGKMLSGGGPKARALADLVCDAWSHFAHTGEPGHGGLPDWPAYETGHRATMIFDRSCRVEHAPEELRRQFWEAIGAPARDEGRP